MDGRHVQILLEKLDDLTSQVARLAYAVEQAVRRESPSANYRVCPSCRCYFAVPDAVRCPACNGVLPQVCL